MGNPEIKIRGAVSVGSSPTVTAPEWLAPDTIKGSPLANRLKTDNPAQNPSLSPAVVSAEVEVPGAPAELGGCKSVICQNVDVGARVGYRFGLGSIPFSAYAQYRHRVSSNLSIVGRGSIGGEGMWGNVPSAKDMGTVSISGTPFQASAGIGAAFTYQNFPLLAMMSVQGQSAADLGHGFMADGGTAVFVTLAGGTTVFEKPKVSPPLPPAPLTDEAKCKAAADALTLSAGALNAAVAQCAGSALPVFEAMAAKLKAFKIVAGDAANHTEYRALLKQFAEGIASGAKTKKLTEPEALTMMRELAKLSLPLIAEMFANPANFKASLETALETLQYPILPLLKVNPSDAATQKIADDILSQTLECAKSEGKGFLPNVLDELVKIGAGYDWLKSHKPELLDAAKKVTPRTDRIKMEKSLKAALK